MVLGLTGGIGSGKSTVADILKNEYGFKYISTDEMAKYVMNHDVVCINELKSAFGDDIYGKDGFIDREKYKNEIYSCDAKRQLSDHIVHPIVWKYVLKAIGRDAASTPDEEERYLLETALPGKNFKSICDELWFVRTDAGIRVKRLMSSRGYTEDYAMTVISKQPSDEEYSSMSDFVIDNSGNEEILRTQIKERLGL